MTIFVLAFYGDICEFFKGLRLRHKYRAQRMRALTHEEYLRLDKDIEEHIQQAEFPKYAKAAEEWVNTKWWYFWVGKPKHFAIDYDSIESFFDDPENTKDLPWLT